MSDDSARIRVLCVDDHPIVRQGIAGLLAAEPDMALVAEAESGREAILQFRVHRPDVTLMDLQMPEMDGLDAISAIRGEFPDARIVVLTTYAGDAQALRALQAGARGYLLKNALHKELLDTIRAVHAGRKALASEVSFELAEHVTDDALTPVAFHIVCAALGVLLLFGLWTPVIAAFASCATPTATLGRLARGLRRTQVHPWRCAGTRRPAPGSEGEC